MIFGFFWPCLIFFYFLGYYGFLDFFRLKKIDFFLFNFIFEIFLNYFLFLDFLNFFEIFGFFLSLFPFKVTKVLTKIYHGYYWAPKNAKNGPKQHNKLFFWPEGQKNTSGKGPSPPQQLEVSPRNGLYLLVLGNLQTRWLPLFKTGLLCRLQAQTLPRWRSSNRQNPPLQ